MMIQPDDVYTIKGKVTDPNKEPLEYFTAMLIFTSDSGKMIGGAFVNGTFEFTEISHPPCSLQISCAGYQPVIIKLGQSHSSSFDVGTVEMLPSRIDEITVQSRRPVFTQKAGALQVQVSGTSLEDAGSLTDVLRMSPGLIVDSENNLTVVGKGSPVIYINDREIQDKAELETLRSNNILNIEINRMPSAEHSASGKAVVRIKTKEQLKDLISAEVYSNSYLAEKFSIINGGFIQGKYKNSSILTGGALVNQSGINLTKNYIINNLPSYQIENISSSILRPYVERQSLFTYFDQQIAQRHNLGIQFYQRHSTQSQTSETQQTAKKTNAAEIKRTLNKKNEQENKLSTLNINYHFNIDSLNVLTASTDFTRVNDQSDEGTSIFSEQNTSGEKENLTHNRNEYNIYSGKIDYKTSLFRRAQLKGGIKYSQVQNKGKVEFTRDKLTDEYFSTTDQIDDRISAAYLTANFETKKLSFSGGIRYELSSTSIQSKGEMISDSTYSHFFPAVVLTKNITKEQSVSISYTKKIDRPRYRELSSEVIYIDPLSYIMGNPLLKPSITHYFNLRIGALPNLTLSTEYRYEQNARIISTANDKQNPEIVKYLPENICNANYLSGIIDYSYAGKKFRGNLSIEMEKPFAEIPYLGNVRKIKKLSWGIQGNTDWRIRPNLSVFSQFHFFGSKETLMTYYYSRYNLTLGSNISFFKRRMILSVMANDIFNSNEKSWKSQYGNISAKYVPDYDYSWIRISIRYNFNKSFKGNLKDQSSNESELNRL